jgi:hypothetical protein
MAKQPPEGVPSPGARIDPRPSVGDLKRSLEESGATWRVNSRLSERDGLPRFPLGGQREDLAPATSADRVNFQEALAVVPAIPELVARRLELGLVRPEQEEAARAIARPLEDES